MAPRMRSPEIYLNAQPHSDTMAIPDTRQSLMRRAARVLLLHGWLHTPRVWDRVIELIPPDVRVVAPSLPGFGGAHCTRSFKDLRGYSREVARRVPDAFADDYDVVAGDSLGGLVALYLIEAGVLRCRGLLLSGVPSSGLPWWLGLLSKCRIARIMRKCVAALPTRHRHCLESWIARKAGLVLGSAPTELDAGVMQADGRVADQLLALLRQVGPDELPQPRLAIHVLRGESDRIVSRSAGRALSQHLRCDYTEFSGSGHCPALDQPLRYARALEEFLDLDTDTTDDGLQ